MKVLYISCEEVPADHAGSVHTYEVAKNLKNLGCEVTLLSLKEESLPTYEYLDGIEIIRTPQKFSGIKFPIMNIKYIPQLLSRKYDIIMERHITASGVGMMLSRFTDTPLVLEINSPHLDEVLYRWNINCKLLTLPMRWWVNRNYKQADGVITTRPSIIPDFARDKGLYLYWGANEKKFNKDLRNTDISRSLTDELDLRDKFTVIFVGSFRIWQGVSEIPEILERTTKLIPSVHLLLIGKGELTSQILTELKHRGLNEHFTYLGTQPHNLIPYYMAISDVGLAPFNDDYYPPLKEFGFFWAPSKIMEYLASGLPVVTADYDTLENILGGGERGSLIPPGDLQGYAEALHRLYNEESLRNKMSERAREYIVQKQSWRKHCSEIYRLFTKILR